MQKKRQELNRKTQQQVNKVLTGEQRKRLGQIQLQTQGIRALLSGGTAKQLQLSEEQQKEIRGHFQAQQQAVQNVSKDIRAGNLQRGEAQEKFTEIRKKTESDVHGVLTEAQQKKFEELKGPKFVLKRNLRIQPRVAPQKKPAKSELL